jgi:hypothetical protein
MASIAPALSFIVQTHPQNGHFDRFNGTQVPFYISAGRFIRPWEPFNDPADTFCGKKQP